MTNNLKSKVEYIYKKGEISGPLGKILSLIEERKLHISDLSLAEIAEDFILYAKNLEKSLNIKSRISFISTASILILIKSKALLPNLSLSSEEIEKIDDLKYRLFLLENIKNASSLIEESYGNSIRLFGNQSINNVPVFAPHKSLTALNLNSCLKELISKVPKIINDIPDIEIQNIISIEEMIASLEERVLHNGNITFKSINISLSKEEKLNTIVTFLAMLELLRQGLISVKENNNDYIINKNSNNETRE